MGTDEKMGRKICIKYEEWLASTRTCAEICGSKILVEVGFLAKISATPLRAWTSSSVDEFPIPSHFHIVSLALPSYPFGRLAECIK